MTTTCLAGRTAPGELLRLVADGLTGAGLDVRPPGDGEGRLDIALPGARCTLAVGECGSAEWEYWPWSPQDADPDLTADLATVLLTGRSEPQPRLGAGHQLENVTFKGIVGLELKARGLDVELAVYCDETAFDTFAEIIATVPGPGDGGGQVCVADDGGLTWTRDCLAEAAALIPAPELCGQAADPASIAGLVVEAVTRAMSLLRPPGPEGPLMGEVLTAPGSRVPHHGPVTRDCPVECLLTVLSLNSFNPLTRAYDAPFDEPRTVGDVVDLYIRHQLRMIRGLGPRRVSEIEAALVLAGLDLTRHQVQPADGKGAAR